VQAESNKHIATFFSITEPTVKAHVMAILRKIGANNRRRQYERSTTRNPTTERRSGDLPVLQRH